MASSPQAKMETDQRRRFEEAAREVGADEDEATFKAKLAVIARQKPKGGVPEQPEEDGQP